VASVGSGGENSVSSVGSGGENSVSSVGSGGGNSGSSVGSGGGNSGSSVGSGGGNSGSSVGSGGGSPFLCSDVLADDNCSSPDADACSCVGCGNANGLCVDFDSGAFDDCTCPSCATDDFCAVTNDACNLDGVCDPGVEGCNCADCIDHPLCPYE